MGVCAVPGAACADPSVWSWLQSYKEKITSPHGDYFLGETIGSGGFASVKAGIHGETGLRVAVKIMPAAHAAEPEHKKEIVHMAALKHPNVVELKDIVFWCAAASN